MSESHDIYERRVVDGATVNVLVRSLPLVAPVGADDVRAEARRRLIALTGARDAPHLEIVLANAMREGLRLMRKGPGNWSTGDALRATALERLDRAIEAVRAASNAMEPAPPPDYRDDARWPVPPV